MNTLPRRHLLAAGAAAGLFAPRAAAALTQQGPTVETRYGVVRGLGDDGVSIFKGIPYGAHTGGARRFQPPAPPEPWTVPLETTELGHYSPQLLLGGGGGLRATGYYRPLTHPQAPGPSEDCLVANVWTPSADGKRRPVMVWLHGGGFLIGSGGSPVYDGAALAKAHDLVVVSLNHRLNVFGFLDLEGLGGPAGSVNAGMMDLVAGLAWVRDNIAAFGGDPRNVTIFGQSGGAGKVSALMAMPAAKGLFHKAIMQSGASPVLGRRQDTREVAELVVKETGAKDIAALQALPTAQLTAAAATALAKWLVGKAPVGNFGFLPAPDGATLPAQPYEPAATALSADVPVMLGYTATEMTLFPSPKLDEAGLTAALKTLLGHDPAAAIAAFRKDYPAADPTELSVLIGTHGFTGLNTWKVAEARAAQRRAPSWLYLFAWETAVQNLRAPHTIEIPFAFHNARACADMVGPYTDDVKRLEAATSGAWAAFARTGNPNHAGLPKWGPYSPARRETMVFDKASKVVVDPGAGERRALMGV